MSTTTSDNHPPPHILIFPYPAQGHTLPLLDLIHQLSLRYHLTITIITTPKNLPTLTPLLSSHHTTIHTLTFPFPPHPALPPGVENVKELGGGLGSPSIVSALTKLSQPISDWFRSHPDPPVALISDFFLGWSHNLAREFDIPWFVFFSSGAFLTSVIDYCWTHLDVVKGLDVVSFPDLPRTPSFKAEHLPSMIRRYNGTDPDWEPVKDGMLANTRASYGCIFNSLEAVESDYLDHLKKEIGHERVYGVGPLSLLGPDQSNRGDPGPNFDSLFAWLDLCPDDSVLYICFGSQKLMSGEQMAALASALEKSGTRFIWVVKTKTGSGSVPEGFEERVSGRGVVVRVWAPQVKILGHKAVGGFLSHCGWNSVLEGIVSGVLILEWPMQADQYVNARLLAEDLGVGVRACEGADTVPDPDELARVIGEWMRGGSGELTRKGKALELKEKALGAVGESGSSSFDLDRLGRELLQLRPKTG